MKKQATTVYEVLAYYNGEMVARRHGMTSLAERDVCIAQFEALGPVRIVMITGTRQA